MWQSVFVTFRGRNEGKPFVETVYLPTNIKKVSAVKLVGCKQDISQHALVLDIKEASTNCGGLLSNHVPTNDKFFMLPYCTRAQQPLWDSSAEGLRCVRFTPRKIAMLTFTLSYLDQPDKYQNNYSFASGGSGANDISQPGDDFEGVCYLWLRILVECDD